MNTLGADLHTILAANIRALLNDQDRTQDDLARAVWAADEANGTKPESLARRMRKILGREVQPDLDTLAAIAAELGVHAHELLVPPKPRRRASAHE